MANEVEDPPGGQQPSESEAMNGVSLVAASFRSRQFEDVCKSLPVPLDIQSKAKDILEALSSEPDHQDDDCELLEADLIVCSIYMALIETRMPYGPHDPQLKQGTIGAPPITVTTVLRKTHTSVKQLLEKMHIVKSVRVLSEAVTEHLVAIEKNFCVMSALSHTFDRLCAGVFTEESKLDILTNGENCMPPIPDGWETEGVKFRRKLCWLLFLHAKRRFLGDNPDLVQGFMILLSCLEYVMRSTPSFLLNAPYDVLRIGCQQPADAASNTMLAKLCEQFSASLEEVEDLCNSSMEPFFQELLNRDGELDLQKLEETYLEEHAAEGDLNELFFLTKDPLFVPSNNHSGSLGSATPTKTCPMTPVRATLNSIQQLKNTLASATDEPSAKLKEYFQACTNDPTAAIAERLKVLGEVFVTKFRSATSSFQPIADPRFTQGVKLYYHMLELMLNNQQESKRLSPSVLSTLLNKEEFHRSLLACCLEVVLVAYGLSRPLGSGGLDFDDPTFAFPWILDTLQIQAYDFGKVLESFIRAEPSLPTDIVRHLQHVEYKILESIAWREGSSLFDVISACDRGTSTPPRNSPSDLFSPSGPQCPSAAEMFLSPMHPRHPPLSAQSPGGNIPQAAGSPARGLPALPRRSQSLTSFFNKVYRLAYHRLQNLCHFLQITKDLQPKIWTCFENCITYQPDLMKNRHLDQILMCSIYGVCKAAEKELRFKTIVQEYKNLHNSDPDVCRYVYMGDGSYSSIILFYNNIFMQAMKRCILQFAANKQSAPTLSPAPHPVSPHGASPVYNVRGRKNFYVSPLKESPFRAPCSPGQLTPSSRQLYCFGDRPGSTERLRSINATVSMACRRPSEISSSPAQPKRRRLTFEDTPPASTADDNQLPPQGAKVMKTPIIVPPQTVPSVDEPYASG